MIKRFLLDTKLKIAYFKVNINKPKKKNLHFKKGDKVNIEASHCYVSYSQFIKRHPLYSIRWAYKVYPNEKDTYTVKGIYRHVMQDEYDINNFVVVVKNNRTKQLFLVGECGILK